MPNTPRPLNDLRIRASVGATYTVAGLSCSASSATLGLDHCDARVLKHFISIHGKNIGNNNAHTGTDVQLLRLYAVGSAQFSKQTVTNRVDIGD